jgi:hypothetical protein
MFGPGLAPIKSPAVRSAAIATGGVAVVAFLESYGENAVTANGEGAGVEAGVLVVGVAIVALFRCIHDTVTAPCRLTGGATTIGPSVRVGIALIADLVVFGLHNSVAARRPFPGTIDDAKTVTAILGSVVAGFATFDYAVTTLVNHGHNDVFLTAIKDQKKTKQASSPKGGHDQF